MFQIFVTKSVTKVNKITPREGDALKANAFGFPVDGREHMASKSQLFTVSL